MHGKKEIIITGKLFCGCDKNFYNYNFDINMLHISARTCFKSTLQIMIMLLRKKAP